MGMTMSQKILAHHAGLDRVEAGQLIECKLDLVLGNDITAPVAIGVFEDAGLTEVFDKNKIALVLDHYTPCKDIKAAQLCATARTFARKHEIKNFFDVGTVGVEHALIPEKGLAIPATASSAPIPTLVHTARWVHSPPVSAPPIWQPVWPPVRPGSKCPRRSVWF